MADHTTTPGKRSRLTLGVVCVALGCYPLSIALGVFPVGNARAAAPMWVVGLSGFVFLIGGCMLILAEHARVNDLLAGVLCMIFAVIGAWVSLFGPGEAFSGGLTFLSHEQSVLLGRWVFGFGALISVSIAIYAFRRAAAQSAR
jgi:hypothetical protein